MTKLNLDKLIYLDLEFISRKYQELTGVNPDENVTKQEGKSAGIKALFMTAGLSTQETRSFKVTSRDMLLEIWGILLDTYCDFKDENFKNYAGTSIVWITGALTLSEWHKSGSDEPGFEFFELDHNDGKSAFLTNNQYLAAGFSELFGASKALKGNVSIPVLCLCRILWRVDATKTYTACPYLITEVAGG